MYGNLQTALDYIEQIAKSLNEISKTLKDVHRLIKEEGIKVSK